MSDKLPWFKFLATDWISDLEVQLLTSRQKGWYIQLLAYCWQEEGLPSGTYSLHRLASADRDFYDADGSDTVREEFKTVVSLFSVALPDGRITHPKLNSQLVELKEKQQRQSEAGQATAAKRSAKHSAKHIAKRSAKQALRASDSVSSSNTENTDLPKEEKTESFEEFWNEYWLKKARKPALELWGRLVNGNDSLSRKIIESVKTQKPEMMQREPSKRPHATTWLNQHRWEDEPGEPATRKKSKLEEIMDSI